MFWSRLVFAMLSDVILQADAILVSLIVGTDRVGNTIRFGEGVPVPMRLRFAELAEGECPRSSSAKFSEHWKNAGTDAAAELDRVVDALRGRKAQENLA